MKDSQRGEGGLSTLFISCTSAVSLTLSSEYSSARQVCRVYYILYILPSGEIKTNEESISAPRRSSLLTKWRTFRRIMRSREMAAIDDPILVRNNIREDNSSNNTWIRIIRYNQKRRYPRSRLMAATILIPYLFCKSGSSGRKEGEIVQFRRMIVDTMRIRIVILWKIFVFIREKVSIEKKVCYKVLESL